MHSSLIGWIEVGFLMTDGLSEKPITQADARAALEKFLREIPEGPIYPDIIITRELRHYYSVIITPPVICEGHD